MGKTVRTRVDTLENTPYLSAGAARTLNRINDNNKTVKLDTAAGSTVTLPPATGSGAKFKFVITTIATSNSHIVRVANASDTMVGLAFVSDDTSDNAVAFAASGTNDTITLNRTTTGSVALGEYIECEDIAPNLWHVKAFLKCTGIPATPFSATV